MTHSLLLSVQFHDGRYHGAGDWPPEPARLFQALVACAAKGVEPSDSDKTALAWLEMLEAPVIAFPSARKGQSYVNYVPNNDLDTVGGIPHQIVRNPRDSKKKGPALSFIRSPKKIQSHIFNREIPLLFIWTFNDGFNDGKHARTICRIAERLYQLGRGVDMAWASAEILDASDIESRLSSHGGVVYRPSKNGTGKKALLCPQEGSLASIRRRYNANRTRFTQQGRKILFSQPPKPHFAKIVYDSPSSSFLLEIRKATSESFAAWPSARVTELVLNLRDKATCRLKRALPDKAGTIDRVLIGRNATEADKVARVRIVPIPSIGHPHADYAIRRVLVEVPPNCPLRIDDLAWAFSGLEEIDMATGEILWNLVSTEERGMLRHYGIDGTEQKSFRIWRTVTPAALPVMRTGHGTAGSKRIAGEEKVARAVMQALRHIRVTMPVASIHVQREPFDRNGSRAEEFAMLDRFAARGLHHVEIVFKQAVDGSLVIGNGRYLGLGLMAPVLDHTEILQYDLGGNQRLGIEGRSALIRHFRRALMALARTDANEVDRLFSGHEPNGKASRSGVHDHVFLAADGCREQEVVSRLILAAPWAGDHRAKSDPQRQRLFEQVADKLSELRAGHLGRFENLVATPIEEGDSIIGPACEWVSQTPYVATRNLKKRQDPTEFIKNDIATECIRRGLPIPENIEVRTIKSGPKGGQPTAQLMLVFSVAVRGPLMLGRDSHMGGGLFHTLA